MTTPRQAEANRRNAQLSTGPRTELGKSTAARNGITHGLAGGDDLLPDGLRDLFFEHREAFADAFDPFDDHDDFLLRAAALAAARYEVALARQEARRAERMRVAADAWDDDRALWAAELAEQLPRRPESTVHRLRAAAAGRALLIGRWQALLGSLDAGGDWDESGCRVALDLLGVPRDLRGPGMTELDRPRAGAEPAAVDGVGAPLDEAAARRARRRAVARREIDRLVAMDGLPSWQAREERARAAAEAGLEADEGREGRLLDRYAARAERRLSWALGELKARQAERRGAAERRAADARREAEQAEHRAREERSARAVDARALLEEETRAWEADAEALLATIRRLEGLGGGSGRLDVEGEEEAAVLDVAAAQAARPAEGPGAPTSSLATGSLAAAAKSVPPSSQPAASTGRPLSRAARRAQAKRDKEARKQERREQRWAEQDAARAKAAQAGPVPPTPPPA